MGVAMGVTVWGKRRRRRRRRRRGDVWLAAGDEGEERNLPGVWWLYAAAKEKKGEMERNSEK